MMVALWLNTPDAPLPGMRQHKRMKRRKSGWLSAYWLEQGAGRAAAPHRFSRGKLCCRRMPRCGLDDLVEVGFVRVEAGDRVAVTYGGLERDGQLRPDLRRHLRP